MKHRVVVEIDRKAVVRNYRRIVARVKPAKVMCVLKANAYGLGVKEYARTLYLAGCRDFGVAEPFEALELKSLENEPNFKESFNIQILSSILPDEIEAMVKADVILPITDLESARRIDRIAGKFGKVARVQLKLDTGMGRLGLLADSTDNVVSMVLTIVKAFKALRHLDVEGAFSHFSMAYEPKNDFTIKQISYLLAFVQILEKRFGITFKKVHIAASDAINNHSVSFYEKFFNYVRTGINLHGSFDPNGRRALKLEPVLTLKTRIAQVRELPKGKTLGYGRTYTLKRQTKVATISAGYADGLPLALSNKGFVLIKGVKCPIIGRISMDYTTVDVSKVKGTLKSGDEVICLGKSGKFSITPDDWAKIKGTHAYDIICSLGSRVERIFK